MSKDMILEWFGDRAHGAEHSHVVKCNSIDEAEEVISILESSGLKQGMWSTSDGYLGIMVHGGEIHAYTKNSSSWEYGTPFEEFMAMFVFDLPNIDDLI